MASEDAPTKDIVIDETWTEQSEGDIYAPWEKIIAESLNGDITNYFDASNQDQTDGIAFDRAAQNLIDKVDEIDSTKSAEAFLETLRQEQIVERKGDKLILFKNVSGNPSNSNYIYNWAVATQLARAKIEDQIERARELDEQLQKDLEEIHVIGKDFVEEDPDEQLHRLDQKFEALGDGEGVPDPETLSQSERREYSQYQRTFKIARSRKRIQERYTVEGGEVTGTDDVMQGQIENFQHLHQAFSEYEKQLRTTIQTNICDYENTSEKEYQNTLINIIAGIKTLDQRTNDMNPHNIKSTVNSLSDIVENTNEMGIQDTGMEKMSHEDIENILNELTDSKEQTYEAGKKISDGANVRGGKENQ